MPTAARDAEKASKGVDGKTVQLIRQASNTGQLYGSVSARDIVEALEGVGAKVTKSQVVLDRPIKAIGVHEVKIALHPEVAVTVKVNVARSPEEADLQAQGVDVMAADVRGATPRRWLPRSCDAEAEAEARPRAASSGAGGSRLPKRPPGKTSSPRADLPLATRRQRPLVPPDRRPFSFCAKPFVASLVRPSERFAAAVLV